ncbi:hypothetical protein GFL95_14345 [Rhizobium leguminosarum bv. viciae]|uniref:hypothetical protein n=1 Tax=Rhizobium leguminosarum TaxID=384 RepID=UPI001440E660|nr:hypothetical protein [Rhizobium leguminosarum]NKK92395.1 hypothetical protein [Rhizobium leguminosarum bv. viciae]
MTRPIDQDVVSALDELRFAEIYLHAADVVILALEQGEDREALALLVSDCARRLSGVSAALEKSMKRRAA